MKKVVKFGGSSLANAEQFRKVGNIVLAEEDRNLLQCVNVKTDVALKELRLIPLTLWGEGENAHILSFDAR